MQDEDITLRRIAPQDTDNIIKWRGNPGVRENFICRDPITIEGHLEWIKREDVAQYIIVVGTQDVGSTYLRDIDSRNQKAEFGIFIGEEGVRGKGVGTCVAKQILEIAFNSFNLNKVTLRVFPENTAAVKTYKRAGYSEVGIFREDVCIEGKYQDLLFMEMLRKDYKK